MLHVLRIHDTGEASRVIGVFDDEHIEQAIIDAKISHSEEIEWGCELGVIKLTLNETLARVQLASASV